MLENTYMKCTEKEKQTNFIRKKVAVKFEFINGSPKSVFSEKISVAELMSNGEFQYFTMRMRVKKEDYNYENQLVLADLIRYADCEEEIYNIKIG